MANGVNLFDLAARITADTKGAEQSLTATQKKVLELADKFKHLDTSATSSSKKVAAGLKEVETSGTSLQSVLQNLTSASVAMQGPLGGIAGRLGGLNTMLGQVGEESAAAGSSIAALAGPIGISVAATVALVAAEGYLLKQFIDLGVATAEWQGNLFDLSQQVGISASTLSELEVVFDTTGGSIESAAMSLGIFQSKMEEAEDPTSKIAKLFKQLGVDSQDTEVALRQTIAGLARMEEGYKQTAAAREIFGRGGKSLLAVAKETNGDLDAMIDKHGSLLRVTKEDAEAADKFNDQLKYLQLEARAAGALFTKDLIPVLLQMLEDAERLGRSAPAAFELLGRAVMGAIPELRAARDILHGIADLSEYLSSHTWFITYQVKTIGGIPIPIPSGVGSSVDPTAGLSAASGGAAGISMFAGLTGGLEAVTKARGGGRGGARTAIDEVAAALERQKTAIEEAFKGADEYQKEIDRLVLSERKHKRAIDDKRMSQLLANAEQLRALRTDEIANDFMRELASGLNTTGIVTDKYDDMLKDVNKTLAKYHTTLKDVVGAEAQDVITKRRQIDALIEEAKAMQDLNIVRQRYAETLRNTRPRMAGIPGNPDFPITDLGGGSVYGRDSRTRTIEEILNSTRERRVNYDPFKDEWEKVRARVGEITQLLSNSIRDGFRDGMKAGAIEFAQGILQMIEMKMLDKLANAITDSIVSGITKGLNGGAGHKSIVDTLLGIGLSAIGGAFGGGFSGVSGGAAPVAAHTSIGHAMGGVLTEPILGIGLRSGAFHTFAENGPETVVPGRQSVGGGSAFHFHYHAPAGARVESRETVRQASEKYRGIMMKHALTG